MILERAVPAKPARRSAPSLRGGTFALEPVEALPRLAERICELAGRGLEANPFLLPEFLEPAIRAFGPKRLKLAIITDREDLRFFAPVVDAGGSFGGRYLRLWTHAYAPLGAPLMDAAAAPRVADALLGHLESSGRSLISFPHLALDGPVAKALKAGAARRGFWTEAGRQFRPVLYADSPEGMSALETMATPKRRRELDRQLRKLSETGLVSFMSARVGSDLSAAFGMFNALESSGWKGSRGTALRRQRAHYEFAREAVTRLAQNGCAAIDVLRVGERPVAALIRFEHGGISIPWKIAYDEAFASFSPGRQLICDETRRWLADPGIRRVDPVCEEGNPLLAGLWRDREPYGTLLVTNRSWGLGARAAAAMIDLRAAGKRRAKQLIWRPGGKPRKAHIAKGNSA